jgi:hypothetical protein
MKYIFIYTVFLFSLILQINAGTMGVTVPLVFNVIVFLATISSLRQTAIFAIFFAVISDMILPGGNKFPFLFALLLSSPFIAVLPARLKKNRSSVLFYLFHLTALTLTFYVLYFLVSAIFLKPDVFKFIFSMPLYALAGLLSFIILSWSADMLDIKETERMVF